MIYKVSVIGFIEWTIRTSDCIWVFIVNKMNDQEVSLKLTVKIISKDCMSA